MIARRPLLIDEPCRHCGKDSHEGHPGGVIAGRWRCTGCKRSQTEPRTPIDTLDPATRELLSARMDNQLAEED